MLQNSTELVIEDDGPGFPPEVRQRAFERFVKGKESNGHGLGLAFVDAVIQAHGGTVKVADRLPKGALISLALPIEIPASKSELVQMRHS